MLTKLENLRVTEVCRMAHPPTETNPRPYRKYRVTWVPVLPAPHGMMIELRRESCPPYEAGYAKCRPDTPVEWLASDQDENPLPFPPG